MDQRNNCVRFGLIAFFGHPLVGVLSLLFIGIALHHERKTPGCRVSPLEVLGMGILLTLLLAMLGLSMLSTGTIYASPDGYIVVHSAVDRCVSFTDGQGHTMTYYRYTVSPSLYEKTFSMYVPKYSIASGVVKMNGSVVDATWGSSGIIFSATTKMNNVAFDGVTFTPVGHGNVWNILGVGVAVIMLVVSLAAFAVRLDSLRDLLWYAALCAAVVVALGIIGMFL